MLFEFLVYSHVRLVSLRCLLSMRMHPFSCFADELPFRAGRKILKEGVREESMEDHFKTQQMEDKEAKYVILTPKNLAMAAPGVLLLCCGLVCPCFRPRRKESSVPVFEKDPNSSEYYYVPI